MCRILFFLLDWKKLGKGVEDEEEGCRVCAESKQMKKIKKKGTKKGKGRESD